MELLTTQARADEAAALASMLLDPVEVDTVCGVVRADDFDLPEHRIIFEGIVSLADQAPGAAIDLVRLRDWLTARGKLAAVGGVDYLLKVVESVPTSANAAFYAQGVKDYSTRRQLAAIAQGVVGRCLKPEGAEAAQIQAEAIKDLSEIDGTAKTRSVSLQDALQSVKLDQDEIYTLTGLPSLDANIIGLGRGHYVVVAGRPGMGKSALMAEIALRLAERGIKVLFFSLEMSAPDIAERLICSRAGLPLYRVIKRELTQDERDIFEAAKAYLVKMPLWFDCHSLTPARLRSAVLFAKRRGQCDVVFVDYLGLIAADIRGRSKYEATTDTSNAIKRLALETNVPIVVGCQLNRLNEGRHDKRPTLADLRDSGAIEQDADIVMMLHRPNYYDRSKPSELCECIIAKNRRGATATIEMGFTGIYTRFYDTTEQEISNKVPI